MKLNAKYHLLYWLSYWLWDSLQEVSANAIAMGGHLNVSVIKTAVIVAFFGLPVKICLFYAVYSFALRPVLLKRQTVAWGIISFVLSVLPALLLQRLLMYYFIVRRLYHIDNTKVRVFNISSLTITLSDILVPVLLLLVLELYRYSRKTREKEILLEKEKLNAELKFLKSQVNPHFLFNSLSTIHAQVQPKAPEAAALVVRLSALMRFMLYESLKPTILLSEEIKLLEDYIELQESRYSEKLKLVFTRQTDNPLQQIAPLILFPFIENAFKHGAGESRFLSFITIDLTLKNEILSFTIVNSLEPGSGTETRAGIGLGNVKRQLELIYPEHRLTIENTTDSYKVDLTIQLHQHEKTKLPDHRG